jgi:TolA-binding protein
MNSKSSQINEIFNTILNSRKKSRIQEQLKLVLSEDIGPSVPGQDMNTNINGAPAFGMAPAQLTMGSLSSYQLPVNLKDKLFKIIQTTPLQDTMAKIDMVAQFIAQMEMEQMMMQQQMMQQQAEMENQTGDMDETEQQMEQPVEGQEEVPQEGQEGQEEIPQENPEEAQEEDIDSEEENPPPKKKKK